MKKFTKTCLALLLFLNLSSFFHFLFPQPDFSVPGISVMNDNDAGNLDDLIGCY